MKDWTDTHAHVYLEEFDQDRNLTLDRARDAGIDKIYMPNIDHRSVDSMMEVELRNPGRCIAMMGLHPCSVKLDFEKELYIVEDWLRKRSFAAVGEVGTDLYWEKTFWDQQKEAFLIQANWARQYNLPLIIHSRDSMDETLELLLPLCDSKMRGVFHCFTGTAVQAKKIAEIGFYVGIGGVATFKNGGLDEVLPQIPIDKIVLETDSPYLAPVPHRGKRNEPSYLALIAEKVATIMKISAEELREATARNAEALFSVKESPLPTSKLDR